MIPSISEYIEINWNIVVKWPSLREKGPYPELFWSIFSRIWTESGEILSVFSLSVGKYGRE